MPEPRPSELRFEIFIDGGCSMCARESRLMARLDRGRGRLVITDIASPDFNPPTGPDGEPMSYETLMRSIHGRDLEGDRAGHVIEGVEVFRRAYAAVGWGWVLAPTAWPILRPIADAMYRFFARWRFDRRVRQGCGLPASATH